MMKSPGTSPETRIENIVATVLFPHSLSIDLEELEELVPGAELQYPRYPGLVIRLERPRVSALIFRTGKMVVAGAKSTRELVRGVKEVLKMLEDAGVRVGKALVQIQNIVASADLKHRVNVEKAAYLIEDAFYEPDQFPGLILRLRDPRAVLLIFSSGKVVIVGAKSEEDVERIAAKIFHDLEDLGCLMGDAE